MGIELGTALLIGGLAVSAGSAGYSIYDSQTQKRQAKHAAEDIEQKQKEEIAKANIMSEAENEARRKRLALYGRQAMFGTGQDTPLGNATINKPKLLGTAAPATA